MQKYKTLHRSLVFAPHMQIEFIQLVILSKILCIKDKFEDIWYIEHDTLNKLWK